MVSVYEIETATISDSRRDIARLAWNVVGRQRFCFRADRRFPVLRGLPRLDETEIHDANYCVTLRIPEQVPRKARICNPLREKRWVSSKDDPLLTILKDLDTALPAHGEETGIVRKKQLEEMMAKIKIKVPAPEAAFREPHEESLEEKRKSGHHNIITKKILMRPVTTGHPLDDETAQVRWATHEEARALIAETTNPQRKRT